MRRATICPPVDTSSVSISIHALLAESDQAANGLADAPPEISIHALLAESDGGFGAGSWRLVIFLSTLSLRRATANWFDLWGWAEYFYPRSPCGERPGCQRPYGHPTTDFYPRSPCGERHQEWSGSQQPRDFYPRSPCGERQPEKSESLTTYLISIHALLAESDVFLLRKITITVDISIHALLAESDIFLVLPGYKSFRFLSTLSLRRATLETPKQLASI